MAITAQLQSLTMPDGTEFPGTPQALSELLAQYYEITGLDTFDGINIGSTMPDSDNRDKPWYKTTDTNEFVGWYMWDGSEWVIQPVILDLKTQVEVDAITTPITGQTLFNTGTDQVEVYTGSVWKPAVPTQARYHYDAAHYYPQHQLLASSTSAVNSWTAIDLTSYITDLGLDEENDDGDPKFTFKAAIVRATIAHGPSGFTTHTWDAVVRVSSSDTYSTSATDVLQARALMTADDSQTAVSGEICGPVAPKTDTNNIYYCANGDIAPNFSVTVWLVGIVYTTTDAYFT